MAELTGASYDNLDHLAFSTSYDVPELGSLASSSRIVRVSEVRVTATASKLVLEAQQSPRREFESLRRTKEALSPTCEQLFESNLITIHSSLERHLDRK